MSVKLLLVFVEYNESNTLLLLQAIDKVDSKQGVTFQPQSPVLHSLRHQFLYILAVNIEAVDKADTHIKPHLCLSIELFIIRCIAESTRDCRGCSV